jgi:hypothetical protein
MHSKADRDKASNGVQSPVNTHFNIDEQDRNTGGAGVEVVARISSLISGAPEAGNSLYAYE